MKQLGLIGYPLLHSFSENYFKDKFRKENITNCDYTLFPLKQIDHFPDLIQETPNLLGLNVTVPYKESIIRYIDRLDDVAKEVGAVNCIKIERTANSNQLIGFNTDVIGFEDALKPHLKSWHQNALILGTGGSAKAVAYVLKKLGVSCNYVSRNPQLSNVFSYNDLSKTSIEDHLLIINTTPIGMFPDVHEYPIIPYEYLGKQHLLFDLIYNPEKTMFLQKGASQGVSIFNGLEMLKIQADKSFEIWVQ